MQKNILIILLTINWLNNLTAQIHKGSWLIDGSLNIAQNAPYIKVNYGGYGYSYKLDHSNANAAAGYFFSDRFMAGTKLDASFIDDLSASASRSFVSAFSKQTFSITPYARYYFTPKSFLKMFYELNLEGRWDRTQWNSLHWQNNLQFTARNKIGINCFLTNNIALEGYWEYLNYAPTKYNLSWAFPELVFNPQFSIKLFLNTKKQEPNVLAKQYLRKGNQTVGLTGYFDRSYNLSGGFTPYIGYFLTDKWMISSSLSVIMNVGRSEIALTPELRYYQPISATTQFFLRGNAVFLSYYNERNNPKRISGGESIEVGIGLNQFVAENISIQATTNIKATGENYNNIYLNPNVKVGFQYFMK
jgi:hypothetical protein